jgi:hypothetical protein
MVVEELAVIPPLAIKGYTPPVVTFCLETILASVNK